MRLAVLILPYNLNNLSLYILLQSTVRVFRAVRMFSTLVGRSGREYVCHQVSYEHPSKIPELNIHFAQ